MKLELKAGLLAALCAVAPRVAGQGAPQSMAPAGPALPPALEARVESLPRLLADPSRYDEAFTAAFRDAVPPAQWRALIEQLAQDVGAPLETADVQADPPWSADVEVRFERALVGLRITVEPAPPFRLAGLLLTGAAPVQAPEATLPAVIDAIRALHGSAALAIARLGTDAPVTLHQVAGDQATSVGSEFKLVILAEIIRAVAAGERGWGDLVTFDGRPLPGGRYASMPAGTTVPLRDVVTAMIAVSDNSAADVMAALLGRGRLEAMLPLVGISRPEGMRPFLTALEAFKLKAMIAAGQTDWLRADEPRRRELLAGPVAAMPLDKVDEAFAPGLPLSIEAVEWRASAEDMVRVLDWIRRHTETGPAAEARAILAANPLIGPRAAAAWGYVGFKGGSEPGVVATSLLLQRRSGEWLAVSAAWNDPANRVDDERFVSLIVRLAALLRTSD